jgi:hypothetical protein
MMALNAEYCVIEVLMNQVPIDGRQTAKSGMPSPS